MPRPGTVFDRWLNARDAHAVREAWSALGPRSHELAPPEGPFCGYDSMGSQTWDEFLAIGPPARIHMPASIAAKIKAYALARKRG